jgi:hypothetical protein
MTETAITSCEFRRRITALCLGGVGPSLPRRRRDRHILLKSVALLLGHGRAYTESTINTVLKSWLAKVGPAVRLDHVSLRRYLIDEGYVIRDHAGSIYEVSPTSDWSHLFEPGVDDVDPLEAVRAARAERDKRRRPQASSRTRQPS